MIQEALVWSIIGLPLASFGLNALIFRPLKGGFLQLSGYFSCLSIIGSFALSLWALVSLSTHSNQVQFVPHTWFSISNLSAAGVDLELTIGLLLDPLAAIMLIVVSSVSAIVHIYSLGYMRNDTSDSPFSDYPRYFAYLSLFTASMLGLVLASNLIQLYLFWELVGLCSYLLIGFWHHRPAAAAAAKKAFIVTRLGDFGFLLALLLIYANQKELSASGLNPFEIQDLLQGASLLPSSTVTWIALGLFAGAVGKSAQFPLHTWLPDAMEGPTPVSSLIHAATMVAAGVFLVTRMFPLFELSFIALDTVALIGGITALLGASMALVSNDIKRVLAYSTMSQLGYMMLALGFGFPAVAIFHLCTHAFFKCLLFLGAGSVNHATATFDMREMGGLRRSMPYTYIATAIGAFSLAGIFPLAGFWSKDEILTAVQSGTITGNDWVAIATLSLGLISVVLTGFYIARLLLLTFHATGQGNSANTQHDGPDQSKPSRHAHEAPKVMLVPMFILGIVSILAGLANSPIELPGISRHWLSHFLGADATGFHLGIALISTSMALFGASMAILVYGTKTISNTKLGEKIRIAHRILSQGFYLDYIYEQIIVRKILHQGAFRFLTWFDARIIDGLVDLTGWTSRSAGRTLAQIQTGNLQVYGLLILFGILLILVGFTVTGT